jgi:hypothetical protein
MSVVGSSTHFQGFRVHNNMNANSAIEKLQRIAKEKEAQRNEHRQRQEEEEELLKRTELEEEVKRAKKEGVLNIQPLVVKSPPHSSSSSKCA